MYNLKKGGAAQKSLIVTKMICLYKMCVSLYLLVNICFAGSNRGPIIERGKVGIPLYGFNSLFYKCVHVLSGFP